MDNENEYEKFRRAIGDDRFAIQFWKNHLAIVLALYDLSTQFVSQLRHLCNDFKDPVSKVDIMRLVMSLEREQDKILQQGREEIKIRPGGPIGSVNEYGRTKTSSHPLKSPAVKK